MRIIWILNGCGLESGSVTGGPVRFHAISSRWEKSHPGLHQELVTTSGGSRMLMNMGCAFPRQILPASLFLKKEPFKAFRFWSYIVTSLAAFFTRKRLPEADVIMTVSDYFCDIIPALLIKRRSPSTKWIALSYHREQHPSRRPGNRIINELTWRMQEWSLAKIAAKADQAWVQDSDAGDAIAARLVELGIHPDKLRMMKNGIDLARINAIPDPAKRVDAVMIGIRPSKGAHDIVPIWKLVQTIRPGTTLRLMGGMVGENALQEEIRLAGLDHLITLDRPESGWLPPDVFFQKVKEARLLFAPSHEEGWGIALCEAMACGLPVVAYDLDAYRRVYGQALTTVRENDHRAFSETICRLLSDSQAFDSMREAGHACAQRYDWDGIAREDWQSMMALTATTSGEGGWS